MTPETFIVVGARPALSILPTKLSSQAGLALVLAICMQESRLEHRRQIGGPARGFPQFELGGIKGVLNHKASQPLIRTVLDRLDYSYEPMISYAAIEHNDVLAFAYARCLLWVNPGPLPTRDNPQEGWDQYIFGWRPGKPHRATWDELYKKAWQASDLR